MGIINMLNWLKNHCYQFATNALWRIKIEVKNYVHLGYSIFNSSTLLLFRFLLCDRHICWTSGSVIVVIKWKTTCIWNMVDSISMTTATPTNHKALLLFLPFVCMPRLRLLSFSLRVPLFFGFLCSSLFCD
jgi:hypothetical protein